MARSPEEPSDGPLERVVRDLGIGDIVEKLAAMPGADLTTLLLATMRLRAESIGPASVLERYQTDRFVRPGPDFALLRDVESAFVEASGAFELLTPAPLAPLGAHSAMGFVDQNNLVATIRNNEVLGDPTNLLALEAALRRRLLLKDAPKSAERVDLGAVARSTRAQKFDGPRSFAHFSIFGLVSAGRDVGSAQFESRALSDHLVVYVRALQALGAEIRVVVSRWDSDVELDLAEGIELQLDPDRSAGYYRSVACKVFARFGGEEFEVGDGGATDWTERLVGSAKERMIVSGVGLDRLVLQLQNK